MEYKVSIDSGQDGKFAVSVEAVEPQRVLMRNVSGSLEQLLSIVASRLRDHALNPRGE